MTFLQNSEHLFKRKRYFTE